MGEEAGRRRGGEENAVLARFKNRRDLIPVRLLQCDAGRVRKQEANGYGLGLAAQVETEIEIAGAEAKEELLPDAISVENGHLLVREVEHAGAEPVGEGFG